LHFNHTDYIQFNQDRTGTQTSSGIVSSFTYTYSEGVIIISIPQKANDGAVLAPLVQTATVKLLITTNLAYNLITTFTFGAGVEFTETSSESFEK
jgi:hypothetical protein